MNDHKLHVAQEQNDSREPRDDDDLCDNCLQPFSAHFEDEEWGLLCPDGSVNEFAPLTEQSERELRAAMRGDL